MSHPKQLCTFFVSDYFFGVSAHEVQEVIRYQEMTRVPLTHECVSGLINLRGQIVTAIDMRKRLGFQQLPEDQLPMNVVIRGEDGAVSLLVDRIGDVIEVAEKDFEAPPNTLRGYASELIQGAYKLDGRLLLVLDTKEAVQVGVLEKTSDVD